MTYVQRKEEELKSKVIPQTKKDDFEAFWREEVNKLRRLPIKYDITKLDMPYYKTFTTYEIAFNTHDRTIVKAWYSVPTGHEGEKLPCVAYFHGGGGWKTVYPDVVATGVCCFAIDVRTQGGTTVDKGEYNYFNFRGGIMARDAIDKNSFAMKNMYLDAVRAIDVISVLPEVDPERIVAYGVSQGGALSIVAGALSGKVKKCYPIVPSFACLEQRVEDGSGVFAATKDFLKVYPHHTDAVMDTLSYFDINNMVSLLEVPVSFCLGLMDSTCLPPYVYSPYVHTASSQKNIELYPFTPHAVPEEFRYNVHREFAAL
ncbi:MAG: acetylxylan esterase [Clostridia bacterium]|nr:acetylxylan esterase [Clostridia bacterium]